MTPSRQVRRAQERAAAKQSVRNEKAAAGQARAAYQPGYAGWSPQFAHIVRNIRDELSLVDPSASTLQRDIEYAKQHWLKRVHRQGPVPVEEVYSEENEGAYLIAPSRPGNKPGTIRVRFFGKNDAAVWTMPTDCGKFELPMASQGEVRPGSAEDIWFKLTAHKRMAMLAAVAHRDIPPKYQAQEVDHG